MNDILTIRRDESAESPREWDNVGTMVAWHPRHHLGDIQPKETPMAWRKENLPAGSVELPLYLFDHSGLSLSTTSEVFRSMDPGQFDWGQVGMIFCSPEKIKKEFGDITPEVIQKVKDLMVGEVKTYNQYLQGSTWVFTYKKALTPCKECGHIEYEEDCCGGFYGDTLDETGLESSIPKDAEPLLQEAWDNRR
jgi:hypothetical protein